MKKIGPVILVFLLSGIFFWKSVVEGLVPIPADLLVGAYYPWLEYKWGQSVGVPVKNPLISDSFSQIYPWKKLAMEMVAKGQWPLWNPYSYSGQPLLANFHSGSLYLGNLLWLGLGPIRGWTGLMILGVSGCWLAMYWLLLALKYRKVTSLLGGMSYALAGYPLCWMEFGHVAQAMIWIPAMLAVIVTKRWWLLPVCVFLLSTAGHFQALVYGLLVAGAFFVYNWWSRKNWREIAVFGVMMGGGLAMAAAQLLPFWEMGKMSIRFGEKYIVDYNYGLLPLKHLVTLLVPDFFGNPTTGNYWGFYNYNETVFYAGVVGCLALVWAIFDKLAGRKKFFGWLAVIALLLEFDTPLGRLVYWIKVPGLSSSGAGRMAILFTLASAVLVADFLEEITGKRAEWKKIIKRLWWIGGCWLVGWGVVWFLKGDWERYMQIAFRNMGWSGLLLVTVLFSFIFRKKRWFGLLIGGIMVIDYFRFGWKYLPFVPSDYIFPATEITDFLVKQSGYFRVERERGEILPPNTWMVYGLASPAGYDPVAYKEYVIDYQRDLNGGGGITRYSELDKNYNAEELGKYNVKYLLAIKRDIDGRIPGELISTNIDKGDWKKVFETKNVAILENQKFGERVRFKIGDSAYDKAIYKIVSYEPNRVEIGYDSEKPSRLILADSWYPGWVAEVNGQKQEIIKEGPFRAVEVSGGEGRVVFSYWPDSWVLGLRISLLAWGLWLAIGLLFSFKYVKKSR